MFGRKVTTTEVAKPQRTMRDILAGIAEPEKILEDAIGRLRLQRDAHGAEMDRLNNEMAIASARLANHSAAYAAYNEALNALVNPLASNVTDADLTASLADEFAAPHIPLRTEEFAPRTAHQSAADAA